MQTANVMIALRGDKGNTVPLRGVTTAEIATLRAMHGDEAVFDIEPCGECERSSREEISRLYAAYGSYMVDGESVVRQVFPGLGAAVPEELADLEIPEEFFKATERAKPAPKAKRAKRKTKADDEADVSADESEGVLT